MKKTKTLTVYVYDRKTNDRIHEVNLNNVPTEQIEWLGYVQEDHRHAWMSYQIGYQLTKIVKYSSKKHYWKFT